MDKVFQKGLSFDDILLMPAKSEMLPREVDVSTRLTRNIRLNIPLVSAAMDTITESRLAIAIAREGGIGILHKNLSIEERDALLKDIDQMTTWAHGAVKVAKDYTIEHMKEKLLI